MTGPYRNEHSDDMQVGRAFFDKLRDDANAAHERKDKPVIQQPGGSRVGQQKQKRKSK